MDRRSDGRALTILRRLTLAIVLALAAMSGAPVLGQSQEPVNLDAIYAIKAEGLQRSQVMDIASYLTDVHGPRVTGTPAIKAAADWTIEKMKSWGLANTALEDWGTFGRGWTNDRFVAHLIAPRRMPLIGHPKAWTPGTGGPRQGDVAMAVLATDADLETFRGQLRGKYVLTAAEREVAALFAAPAVRHSDADLDALARQPVTPPRRSRPAAANAAEFNRKRMEFLLNEGVLATIEPGRGDGGTVFVQSGGSRNASDPQSVPQIVLAVEHYNQLVRILDRKIPVRLELDVANTFHDQTQTAFNVVGEIPGTDRADELVMIGAHFDSWHAGTGATDNASGSAVMLEAMRILKATGLPLRRTVRIALWTGEEQGLLGSRAYVDTHFVERSTMTLRPGHSKLSAYFNMDNGTGAFRGIYLQGNERLAPVFRAWMEPFENMGMTTLSIRNTGGTDHVAFDEGGLPGFQFIQDWVEYNSRTHHSSMDVYDRLQAADLMQNAVIVASFVYHAANRDELLPRKPLPAARPRTN